MKIKGMGRGKRKFNRYQKSYVHNKEAMPIIVIIKTERKEGER